MRAKDTRQRERADADGEKDRPQRDSRASEPVLQPVGLPEPRHVAHRGAGARDQDEFADQQPVRRLKPAAQLETEVNQPHRDQDRRHQQHPPQFGGAPLELPHDQDPDPDREEHVVDHRQLHH
ncbi:hypothetical protein CU254_28575 [Amycolatopsis sp. AA4]|nr:hypothetical protein CU254_28575 [Amycolatopsis sp. AA4]